MRRLLLLAVVGLAGAGVAILPSLGSAQATMASFTAVDGNPFFGVHSWYLAGTTTSAVTIAPGDTVGFSYPNVGTSYRNAVFTGPRQPACTQTAAGAGSTIGPAPPLPRTPELPGWSGTCRFDVPGVYTFQDDPSGASDTVTGTITVATTTTTTTTTTTSTQTSTGTTSYGYPPFPAAASSLRASTPQRGTSVRGRIHVTTPSSRLVADLVSGRTRFGRTTLFGVADGTRQFVVRLYPGARKALRLRHRLTLTLRVQVLGQGLGPTALSRHVTLID